MEAGDFFVSPTEVWIRRPTGVWIRIDKLVGMRARDEQIETVIEGHWTPCHIL